MLIWIFCCNWKIFVENLEIFKFVNNLKFFMKDLYHVKLLLVVDFSPLLKPTDYIWKFGLCIVEIRNYSLFLIYQNIAPVFDLFIIFVKNIKKYPQFYFSAHLYIYLFYILYNINETFHNEIIYKVSNSLSKFFQSNLDPLSI